MESPQKVMVPVDFSRHSRETLDFALSLRDLFPVRYLLLHVLPDGDLEVYASTGLDAAAGMRRRLANAQAQLEQEAERCRKAAPGVELATRVVSGVPFREICRMADEEGCRLIVIGTHGRTGLSHLLIGSTAERVVQHAPCPVLSVKPRVL